MEGRQISIVSLHAAAVKESYIFYLILFAVTLPLFYLFITQWFNPTLGLPRLATALVGVGIISQLIAAIIPDREGWKSKVHRLCAYIMSFILMVFVAYILFVAKVSPFARVFSGLSLAIMAVLWTIVVILAKQRHRFLIYQASYVVCFHLTILVATYFR